MIQYFVWQVVETYKISNEVFLLNDDGVDSTHLWHQLVSKFLLIVLEPSLVLLHLVDVEVVDLSNIF